MKIENSPRSLRRLLESVALIAVAALPAPLFAQGITGLADIARVELLPGWRAAPDRHMAGLRVRLAPGWKTYWRAPGDSGIPPQFSWQGSRNLAQQRTFWPVPEVFDLSGLRSVGYKGEIVLPLEFTATTPGEDIMVQGRVDLGVCEDICVPISVEVSAVLNAGNTATVPEIAGALRDQPQKAAVAGVTSVICRIDPGTDGLSLQATIAMPQIGLEEWVVFEMSDPSIWVDQAKTTRQGESLTASTSLSSATGGAFPLSRDDIRITVIGKGRAVDIRGCPAG